ncbi:elongation factor 1-beta [Candidatus Woesearchaeota archaeon]|nr:elongation factor 1-beta [Candidatus Woesearchaeota archaeon]
MASVIITFKVTLESPDVDADGVKYKVINAIEDYGADVGKSEIEEVAYGIKAVKIIFIMDESKGATDPLEEKVKEIEGVSSVEVVDVRRAIG